MFATSENDSGSSQTHRSSPLGPLTLGSARTPPFSNFSTISRAMSWFDTSMGPVSGVPMSVLPTG
jgi:hypothetical protein